MLPTAYLFWIGLRLSKRSIELSIFGISKNLGIGREKGVPLWFVYDLQLLVFSSSHFFSPIKFKDKSFKQDEAEEDLLSLKDILDKTPYEIHKKIIIALKDGPQKVTDIVNKLQDYPRKDINSGIDALRKKRIIYFMRKTKEWTLNFTPDIGINKKNKGY